MRPRPLAAVLAFVVALAAIAPTGAIAQDGPPGVVVTLEAVAPGGPTGLAILTARDDGTAANLLGAGAPAGTTAVVHRGTCAAIDPLPVGLLGDLGAAGQLSTVIPVPFATVADGAHVVVLHPGLDLATALACGAIPFVAVSGPSRTDGPGATTAPATPAPGPRFESPTFGLSLTWAAPWTELPLQPIEGIDAVRLGDGTNEVIVAAYRHDDGDALACVRAWEGRVLATLRDGVISDLLPVTAPDGSSLFVGDAERATGAYQFTFTAPESGGTSIVEHVECRRLSGDAVLEVTLDTPAEGFAPALEAVAALLGGLDLSGVPVTPTPGPVAPTPAPTTAPPPTPAPTPAPTPDTTCAGMDPFVAGVLARLQALLDLAEDARTAANSGMQVYADQLATNALAVQELLIAQQREVPPASAVKIQEDMLRLLRVLADAYSVLAQSYSAGDSTLLQEGLEKAGEAEALATSVRRSLRDVATPCGITVPAV